MLCETNELARVAATDFAYFLVGLCEGRVLDRKDDPAVDSRFSSALNKQFRIAASGAPRIG
jgi:hypothetical protein